MFDLEKSVYKQEQLKADMVNGLLDKPTQYQEPIQHISADSNYEQDAENEGKAISRAFRSRSHIRLKRTYKVDGDTFPTGEFHRSIGRNY